MRKVFLFLFSLLLLIVIGSALVWTNKKTFLTHFLSKQLHTNVTIGTFDIAQQEIDIGKIWIGNPPPSQTSTAFTANHLSIQTTIKKLLGDPLLIEEIEIDDIFVGLEFYNQKGDDNNWSRMLQNDHEESKNPRPYLIRTLILRNLTVQLTKADGTTKKYPTIAKMEFHDISNETGFPIEEIQKAIFKLMLQDLFKQLNLDQLFQNIIPNVPSTAPLRLLPKLFGSSYIIGRSGDKPLEIGS